MWVLCVLTAMLSCLTDVCLNCGVQGVVFQAWNQSVVKTEGKKNHIVLFVCLKLVVARLWASLHIYYVLFYRVSGKFSLKLFVHLMSKKNTYKGLLSCVLKHYDLFFLPPSVWVICLFDSFTNKSCFFFCLFVFCQAQGRYENPKTKVDH